MSTNAQFKANQANAAKSTGPTSQAGESAASKNHLITGLFTHLDYVKTEERDIYKIFYETMFADLGPSKASSPTTKLRTRSSKKNPKK